MGISHIMKILTYDLHNVTLSKILLLQYFFGCKTELFFFSFPIPENLGPCFKMDLGMWDYLGRLKLVK